MSSEASAFSLTPEQIAKCEIIVQRIAEGESLRKICKGEDLPKMGTFLGWVARLPELAEQYARARDVQMDVWAEECLAIADDDSDDIGFKESTDKDGQGGKPFIKIENIQRAKLKIDERHWQMSKQRPKKYGDLSRHEHSGPDGNPVEFSVAISFIKPPDGPADQS